MAGLLPAKNRNRPTGRPKAGRRADFGSFPVAVRPKSGPEGRFTARKHYCVIWSMRFDSGSHWGPYPDMGPYVALSEPPHRISQGPLFGSIGAPIQRPLLGPIWAPIGPYRASHQPASRARKPPGDHWAASKTALMHPRSSLGSSFIMKTFVAIIFVLCFTGGCCRHYGSITPEFSAG